MASTFSISRDLPDEITVRLSGELDEEALLAGEREVRTQLTAAKDGTLDVLWDLRGVSGYSLDARSVLVRLQRFLAPKARRTVYVADRAETRSLALWAVHMAGHWHAHIAPDPESGRAWLRGRGSDHTGVRRLASNPPPAPGSLKPMVALKPTPEPFDKAAG